MTVIAFDTLAYSEELKAAGVPEEQAKAHARILSTIANERLVTNDHLDARLKELEYRLVTRLGGLMIAGVSLLAVIIKLH